MKFVHINHEIAFPSEDIQDIYIEKDGNKWKLVIIIACQIEKSVSFKTEKDAKEALFKLMAQINSTDWAQYWAFVKE